MKILPITQQNAEEIVAWKYPDPYGFYDLTADPEDYQEFISPSQRSEHTYAAWDQEDLIGFFTFHPIGGRKVEMGLGLHPDRTGKGFGESFVKEGLAFARDNYRAEVFLLAVALFNKRAIKVYEKIGFKKTESYQQRTNGDVYPFVKMEKDER